MATTQTVELTFTGVEDSITATFPDMGSTGYLTFPGVETADGDVSCRVDPTTKTSTSCDVIPSGRFTGVVNLVLISNL